MLKSNRLLRTGLLAAAIYAAATSGSADPAVAALERVKGLGMQALDEGEPARALDYFREYRQAAVKLKDRAAIDEADSLAFDAALAVNDLRSAKKIAERRRLEMGEADAWSRFFDIALNPSDNGAAALRAMAVNPLTPQSLVRRVLYQLGHECLARDDFDGAVKHFRGLRAVAGDSGWSFIAARDEALTQVLRGKPARARRVVSQMSIPSTPGRKTDIKLLKALLNLELEQDLTGALKQYESAGGEPRGALRYFTARRIAAACREADQPDAAADKLRDALKCAPGVSEKRDTTRELINALVAAEMSGEAIELAEIFIKDNPDAAGTPEVEFALANMMFQRDGEGDLTRALAILSRLAGRDDDGALTFSAGLNAIKAEMALAGRAETADKAERIHASALKRCADLLAKTAPDENAGGEAMFRHAELSAMTGDHQTAASEFDKVASSCPRWREEALYQSIKAKMALDNHQDMLDTAIVYLDDYKSGGRRKDVVFFQALALTRLGKTAAAAEIFDAFVDKYPNHRLVPEALFESGSIAFADGRQKAALAKYSEIIDKHPDSELAPKALLRRIFCRYLTLPENFIPGRSGDEKNEREWLALVDDIDNLEKKHPDSPLTIEAMFWMMSFLRDSGLYDDATKYGHERILAHHGGDSAVAAKVLYECALTEKAAGDRGKQAEYLEKLTVGFPGTPEARRGDFLYGDMLSSEGEYAKALKKYEAAAETPDQALRMAAKGRMGDCHFALYSVNPEIRRDFNQLNTAIDLYEEVLSHPLCGGGLRGQVLYRLGKSHELLDDPHAAVVYYNRVIDENLLAFKRGTTVDMVWLLKAADSAIDILEEAATPAATRRAAEICRKMAARGIATEKYRMRLKDMTGR